MGRSVVDAINTTVGSIVAIQPTGILNILHNLPVDFRYGGAGCSYIHNLRLRYQWNAQIGLGRCLSVVVGQSICIHQSPIIESPHRLRLCHRNILLRLGALTPWQIFYDNVTSGNGLIQVAIAVFDIVEYRRAIVFHLPVVGLPLEDRLTCAQRFRPFRSLATLNVVVHHIGNGVRRTVDVALAVHQFLKRTRCFRFELILRHFLQEIATRSKCHVQC